MLEQKVECYNHGLQKPAFVCQHLNLTEKVGFNEPFIENKQDQEELNAWCNECEKIREIEGEWNDKSEEFAKIKLICAICFFEMKKVNQ